MNEIASENDCAANHPDYYWPPAESVEAYKNLIFNCVIFQYVDGYFMAASADAKGIDAVSQIKLILKIIHNVLIKN